MARESSILYSTKKVLLVPPDYTAFDESILMHINTAFFNLNQIGIGPEQGFSIDDSTSTWDEFTDGDPRLDAVKTFIYLTVRMLFDPPGSAHLVDSMNRQLEQMTWRLNVLREELRLPVGSDGYDQVIDGGQP